MKAAIRRTKPKSLVSNSRWAAYATAGAATAVACAETAEASIHHVVVGQTFGGSTSIGYFPLAPGASMALAWFPQGSSSTGFAGWAAIAPTSTAFDGVANGGFRYPFRLAAGQSIAAGPFVTRAAPNILATLAFAGGYANSQWKNVGDTGYIGFKFNTGAGVQYAWAQLTMDTGTPLNFFTLVDYAWGDVGDVFKTGDLTVAAVPEPATFGVGLLAAGAIGVSLLRRRRANTAPNS